METIEKQRRGEEINATMLVTVEAANAEERQIVRTLFSYYFQDMAQYDDGIVINAFGLPVWAGFDGEQPKTHEEMIAFNWWIRDSCHSFLIRTDGVPAGFAFVNPGPAFVAPDIDFDVQDFFVLAKFRGQGVGRAAAKMVFDKFRGRWEVFQLARNAPAIAFWNRLIGEYTDGNFKVLDDGARQRFRNDGL